MYFHDNTFAGDQRANIKKSVFATISSTLKSNLAGFQIDF